MDETTTFDEGAPLVHVEYGVGRYEGLTRIELDGEAREFATLRYADEDKLHVPVHSLHLLSRYNCIDCDAAPLHALGDGARWREARETAARDALATAARLLEARARREALEGFGFDVDRSSFEAFAAEFPFTPTADQQAAIIDVLGDLSSAQPMDRVVCGDVGFGKTEVALRAAFVAVDAGTQVAVIVPTTVLARQHHAKFVERFAGWPVEIATLCGTDPAEERERVLERLASGELDIVVGTHAVLGDDIAFDALGLVIVDEEQRFGAADKERVHALRDAVHVMTLTATPIPRTLRMGLTGVRDLSVVATPPPGRLPVETTLAGDERERAYEACRRELERGGQVYWLHNEIDSIERAADEIAERLDGATVGIAHGQMDDGELARVMDAFVAGESGVLVATTIIESGIDVANANTIVVEGAERLGLSQLHQLRGRVGRGERQARAVLLSAPLDELTPDARKRLEAIASNSGLGAGLDIARHDMDIRGAGELLGEEQSGRITGVGLALYSTMLAEAVAVLQDAANDAPDALALEAVAPTTVELGRPATIAAEDVADEGERLAWYLRIDAAPDEDTLDAVRGELLGARGTLAPPTRRLFDTVRLRHRCRRAGIRSIDMGEAGGVLVPRPERSVRTRALETCAERFDVGCRLDDGAIRVDGELGEHGRIVEFVDALLDAVEANVGVRPSGRPVVRKSTATA